MYLYFFQETWFLAHEVPQPEMKFIKYILSSYFSISVRKYKYNTNYFTNMYLCDDIHLFWQSNEKVSPSIMKIFLATTCISRQEHSILTKLTVFTVCYMYTDALNTHSLIIPYLPNKLLTISIFIGHFF